jgi:hypothetical protein
MKLSEFQTACTTFSKEAITKAAAMPSCSVGEWSLPDLSGHLVMVNIMCSRSLEGFGPETLPDPAEAIGSDVFATLSGTSTMFCSTFAAASDVNKICPTPVGPYPAYVVQTQGSLEHLIHGIDVAIAYELPLNVGDDVIADAATRILASAALYDQFRSMGMYSEPTAAAPDASAAVRLLAYLGRS